MPMLRVPTLLKLTDKVERICGFLSQTNCNCTCPCCADTCTDCVDCPDLTTDDIVFLVYRSGDINPNTMTPNYLLMYSCFTFDPTDNKACFLPDMQFLNLPVGRYEVQVNVMGNKSGLINVTNANPYNICQPFASNSMDGSNDMQPSG